MRIKSRQIVMRTEIPYSISEIRYLFKCALQLRIKRRKHLIGNIPEALF